VIHPAKIQDLAMKRIRFAALRIKGYRSHIKPLLRRCLEEMSNEGHDDSEFVEQSCLDASETTATTDGYQTKYTVLHDGYEFGSMQEFPEIYAALSIRNENKTPCGFSRH
jgi:hypothetical protein